MSFEKRDRRMDITNSTLIFTLIINMYFVWCKIKLIQTIDYFQLKCPKNASFCLTYLLWLILNNNLWWTVSLSHKLDSISHSLKNCMYLQIEQNLFYPQRWFPFSKFIYTINSVLWQNIPAILS